MYSSTFIKYPSKYIMYSNENTKYPTEYFEHPHG